MASRSSAFDLGELTARSVASSIVTSEPVQPGGPRRPIGLTTFTLDGRAAPALFVVGWLASLIGLGAALIAASAAPGLAKLVLFASGTAVLTVGLITAAGSQAIERRAAGGTPYTGPSPVLVFAATVSSTLLLSVVLGSLLALINVDLQGPAGVLISSLTIFVAYVALLRFLVVGTGALSWREMGLPRPGRRTVEDAAWGIALATPVLVVTLTLLYALSRFLPIPPSPLPPASDPTGVAVNVLAAVVLAPVGEELFFRGFATTAWARAYGRHRAILQSSLFFAAAHVLAIPSSDFTEGLKLAVVAFVARIPVGYALGWLYLERRSLVAPIALHATFNGLQLLLLAAASTLGAGP
jgi:CAAX protease family protein